MSGTTNLCWMQKLINRMSKTLTVEDAHHLVSALLHQSVQQARIGHGSFVTLEFGSVQSYYRNSGNPKYEWLIWLYQCNWRFVHRGTFVTGCADSSKDMATIQLLKGKQLLSLCISALLDLQIEFDEGYMLQVLRHAGEDTDHWLIYTPDNFVLTARGDTLILERSDAP